MLRINQSLNEALRNMLAVDEKVICIGEDIEDPYGGAFKVTRGLSTEYPGRVISSPISEAGIIGLGTGLSMKGYKPIIEIMFGDFLLLGADQIINHLSKFALMHENSLKPANMVIRAPMGGGRGYGPSHSQSLEKHFLGVPGINLVAINQFSDAGDCLRKAVYLGEPVIFIENKSIYPRPNAYREIPVSGFLEIIPMRFPVYRYGVAKFSSPDFTLVAYGGVASLCYEAINWLYEEEELIGELFVPTEISSNNLDYLIPSVNQSKTLFTVEEGNKHAGFGAEVISTLQNKADFRAFRVGMLDGSVIPNTRSLEDQVIPTTKMIIKSILDSI